MVQKSGAWFAYGDERLGQGRENSKTFLKENEGVRNRILAEIYEKLGFDNPNEEPAEDGLGAAANGVVEEPLVAEGRAGSLGR